MRLRTLGTLAVEGAGLKREKVLLLLAYLCLEGPQPRRRLADVFWPDAANPMNSLAQHLVHLRGLPGALHEEGSRVEAALACDAAQMRAAARSGLLEEAVSLYGGPFLDSLTIPLGADLEEWVYETREALALEMRAALLTLGGQTAARGNTEGAGTLAAHALMLPGAPPPDESELPRLYHLLNLSAHPLAAQVERDARTLGVPLDSPSARIVAAAPFVGRAAELGQLAALPPGSFAWVSGPGGMGKTALLDALNRAGGWQMLTGSPEPYATLSPLLPRPVRSVGEALSAFKTARLKVAIDDWDSVDDASREVLTLAARQAVSAEPGGAVIVVTSRRHPPFEVRTHLTLGLLEPEDVQQHGLHALTDGHPTLVGAALRGQPLELGQGAKVRALPPELRDTFLLLALQDDPDLRATRAALNLHADAFARILSALTVQGLTGETGRVYAAAAIRHSLSAIYVQSQLLHLRLARALPPEAAWPHYAAARDLWEGADDTRIAALAATRADALIRRGHPGEARALLDSLPAWPELAVPHAWALLGAGQYAEALRRLDALTPPHADTPAVLAARATALVRMGRHAEAGALAGRVTGTGAEGAQAASVLAHAARIRESWDEARRYSRIAADLWQLNGDEEQHLSELGFVALARVRLGAAPAEAFEALLERAKGLPSVRGTMLVNYGFLLVENQNWGLAQITLHQAAEQLKQAGDSIGAAQAMINLGLCFHLQFKLMEALGLYKDAVYLLRGTGSIRNLGLALSNLSEIEGDLSEFEDVMEMLERAGQHELVASIRRNAQVVSRLPPSSLQS
ncbi:tetratricopeptide repeat protein [Deinococcus sp. Arct2-2]|uniref:tetratricopeptide repeat protein n=1 Tax=Deinococcus sp. Arct2-2 TaxID=2568653 RepID=UPI0010A440D2|nr:tetratricopeptide repeat protein [Deinococcus sp. Arct2-2]THF68257.1 tetratricopeptide repeat protein [Deinococcus sp. Arct2-2]